MNRRKFIGAAIAVPIVLSIPFWQKPVSIMCHYRDQYITFTAVGDKITAKIPGYQLGMIAESGDGDLSLDRWFTHDVHSPSLRIDCPDNYRLDTLRFAMERTIDNIHGAGSLAGRVDRDYWLNIKAQGSVYDHKSIPI